MATTTPTNQELYDAVSIAIKELTEGAVEWSVDGTTYKRSNLDQLMSMRKQLAADISRQSGNRPFMKSSNFTGMGYN